VITPRGLQYHALPTDDPLRALNILREAAGLQPAHVSPFYTAPSAKRGKMTDMGEAKGPFGGSSHSSASAEDVWAVWTNPAEWPGDVIAMAKIDGPFAVGALLRLSLSHSSKETLPCGERCR